MSAWGHTKVNSKGTQVPPEMQEVPARVPGRGVPGCSGEGAHRVERLFDSVVNGPPVRGPLPRIPHHVVQAVSIGGEGIDLRAQKGSCCHSARLARQISLVQKRTKTCRFHVCHPNS